MKNFGVMVSTCFILLGIVGCRSKIKNVQFDDGGVVVSGYNSLGYIENRGDLPVRVRCVTIEVHEGEITQWIKLIQPGPQYRVEQYIECTGHPQRFYVYDIEGILIGFIKPTKVKNK
jgi:hypothetical protein